MAKCHWNVIGSLVFDSRTSASSPQTTHFRLWTPLSGSSFRRKIFDTVSCGGSSRYRNHMEDDSDSSSISTSAASTITTIADICSSSDERRSGKEGESASVQGKGRRRGEKLSDLLSMAEAESETETLRKEEELEELKQVVRELQCGDDDTRRCAACKARLLAKDDSKVRLMLAMLGAIPPLVGLLDLEDLNTQIASLYALLNLCIGNDVNKAAIVIAGAVHKMLKLVESLDAPNPSISEAIAANFLCLSALDSNKPVIGSSGAIPFLLKTLKNLECSTSSSSSYQAKQDALRALYNLSLLPSNILFILETDAVPFLINSLGDMEMSERLLSVLSNIVSTLEGRRAVSNVENAYPILVDVLNWTDSPGCQEKASYILMVMAHKSHGDRQVMIEAGIISSLLELTLLGTTVAQKRGSRILECLTRVDKGKLHNSCSSDVSLAICGEEYDDDMSEEKKAVRCLVQQSLENNMRIIVDRANLPGDFVPCQHFKSLTAGTGRVEI